MKIKHINRFIALLQDLEKNGGDLDTYSLSNGIREATPLDPEYDIKNTGYTQNIPDGSFSLVITGTYGSKSNTKSKKRTGKKKGEKRSS